MTLFQFLSILRARKLSALLVFALVVGATIGLSLVLPKQYTAVASVVVDVKPDPVSAMVGGAMAMPAFMATQVDILSSERVVLRVIKDLKLGENSAIRTQWQENTDGEGTFEQWLVELLVQQLDVKPSRESNVISISYKSPEPRFAAGLANAFAQAYIATTLELRVEPAKQFTSFFNQQTQEARDALEASQRRVSKYQQDKGIVATDERLDVENARLNELSSQLTQLQAISAESTSRVSQAAGRSEALQEVLGNPVIGALKADLSRSEAKLSEISQRLGNMHPQVMELRASIAELRNRIAAETSKVAGGAGVSNAINKGREAQIRAALELQRKKVLEMKAVRDEVLVLQREVENSQRLYDNLTARLGQATLEAQNTQSYVSMLTVAQPPNVHSSPKLLLNTAVAIVVGALLALGVALLRELGDRRVRTVDDLVTTLGLPVLGAIAPPKARRLARMRLPFALISRNMNRLPSPKLPSLS